MKAQWRIWILAGGGAMALSLTAASQTGPAPAKGIGEPGRLDLESVLTDVSDLVKLAAEDEGPGDNRQFTINTDDDVTSLEVGDIYKTERSVFKIVAIRNKGAAGGKFVAQRIGGRAPPGRKWSRVSGLGPVTIVSRETLWDLYKAGGVVMHPIALCMVATIIIALNSLWVYRRGRQCPASFVEAAQRALQEGDLPRFEDLARRERGLFGHICRAMAAKFHASTMEDIRARCEIEAGRQVGLLRIPLRALNFISAVAPLLGLFGTVVGMVTCFESIAFEAASASKAVTLAAGIRVALFTTVGGLAVAIPTLFILFIFNSRLNAIVSDCELLTEQFLHEISVMKRDEAAARPA